MNSILRNLIIICLLLCGGTYQLRAQEILNKNEAVKIALENVVPFPQGSEVYLLGDNIEDFKYIFENIDSNHLKFCLDTGHANMGEGVIDYINNLHEKIICKGSFP